MSIVILGIKLIHEGKHQLSAKFLVVWVDVVIPQNLTKL